MGFQPLCFIIFLKIQRKIGKSLYAGDKAESRFETAVIVRLSQAAHLNFVAVGLRTITKTLSGGDGLFTHQ